MKDTIARLFDKGIKEIRISKTDENYFVFLIKPPGGGANDVGISADVEGALREAGKEVFGLSQHNQGGDDGVK